jgi:hypothetical protein
MANRGASALYDCLRRSIQNGRAHAILSHNSGLFGPFEPLMHSPAVMSQARAMGDSRLLNAAQYPAAKDAKKLPRMQP